MVLDAHRRTKGIITCIKTHMQDAGPVLQRGLMVIKVFMCHLLMAVELQCVKLSFKCSPCENTRETPTGATRTIARSYTFFKGNSSGSECLRDRHAHVRDAPPLLTLMVLGAVYSRTIRSEKLSRPASLGSTLTY